VLTANGTSNTATSEDNFTFDAGTNRAKINGHLVVGNITPISSTTGRIEASDDIVAFSTSDGRLKENIRELDGALDKVRAIRGVSFDWRKDMEHIHGYRDGDVGVIAQELQQVLPEAIRQNESGYLSVRYEKIIPLLVEVVKELDRKVDALTKQNNELQNLLGKNR